jgi:hypothetical protein
VLPEEALGVVLPDLLPRHGRARSLCYFSEERVGSERASAFGREHVERWMQAKLYGETYRWVMRSAVMVADWFLWRGGTDGIGRGP